jgi:hypothetical protein
MKEVEIKEGTFLLAPNEKKKEEETTGTLNTTYSTVSSLL